MEEVIKKAIEGGWTNFKPNFLLGEAEFIDGVMKRNVFILDPLFWQALGKACGWYRKEKYCPNCKTKKVFRICPGCQTYQYEMIITAELWKNKALRFHEINLTEGFDKAVEYLINLVNVGESK